MVLGREGVFRKLETSALDTQTRLLGTSDTESDITIVQIDDHDYRYLFQNKSPLDPVALKKVIDAIARGNPGVIGVDLDTTSTQFRDFQLEGKWPRIVWARTAAYSQVTHNFHLFDPLGGREPVPLSGMALLKKDEDGALRRYSRAYEIPDGEVPSFPTAVANQFRTALPSSEAATEDLFIRYSRYSGGSKFVHINASAILEFAKESNWPNNPMIKDRIVLLGSAYAAADEHDTPLGWANGVDVMAFAVQTELDGGGVKPASRLVIIFLEIFDGVLLLLVFHQFRLIRALGICVIGVPVIALLCSLLAFKSLAFWAYFVPILIAIVGQQLFEKAKNYRKNLVDKLYEDVSGTVIDGQSSGSSRTRNHQRYGFRSERRGGRFSYSKRPRY